MSAITDVPAEVEVYLAAVRTTLSDLPAAERDDLLAEVESSLCEAAEEGGAIGARLGSPEEFAAELRSAAGLHEPPELRAHVTLRAAATRLAAHPRLVLLRRLGAELAPVWWFARAYVAVAGFALLTNRRWSTRFPAVPRFGSAQLGVASILLAVVASVALGLRRWPATRRSRGAAIAANVVCVAFVIPVAAHLGNGSLPPPSVVTFAEPYTLPGLVYNGASVQNIYPYTTGGKLLHDVLLYDGAGKPIDIGNSGVADPTRRVLTTTANTSVLNAFPIRYFEPGTVRVAHPNAGPPVHVPAILPPR